MFRSADSVKPQAGLAWLALLLFLAGGAVFTLSARPASLDAIGPICRIG